jgi:hypothetical protein
MRTNNFDWSKNYWECFPEITTIVSFKEFKDKDKSKNKEESSRIMWAIHLCLKPNSLLYNDPEKWNRVKVSILEDSKFKWDKYENLKTDYMELVLAPAEKYFHILNDSQMRVVESMSTNMYKIGLEYDKVKKLLNEEYSNTEKPKSLMDE